MCGIAGVMHWSGGQDEVPVERMIALLRHRGPDASGVWRSAGGGPRVQLGHTRLSIIDLAASTQPMVSPDGRHVLVFNGEILNYRQLRAEIPYAWRTNGDTEVLLAGLVRHGPAFAGRLRGQFAFALFDTVQGSLLLGRDRLGILPLVVHRDAHGIRFASEVKALLPAVDPQVDLDSLDAYLAYGAVPAPFTLFTGIRKLLPGHTLLVDRTGRCQLQRYSPSPQLHAVRHLRDADAVQQVGATLRSAVEAALVADVPVGAYLSGGLDSSLIVALIRTQRPGSSLLTFSAGFGDGRVDETGFARMVAQRFGTTHHQVDVRAEDFLELWPQLTWHRDAPLSQPADIAVFRLAQSAAARVKVVLSGEGSDELFAGYPKYSLAGLTGVAAALNPMAATIDARMGRTGRARIVERAALAAPAAEAVRAWFAPFPAWRRQALLGSRPDRPLPAYAPSGQGRTGNILLHDLQTWLPDNLLERGDRMSMAASLELRPPFLDTALVELAARLPRHMKVRRGSRKWIVKQVAAQYLPTAIVQRRKIGFRVPLDAWFRDGLAEMTADLLRPGSSFVCSVLDRTTVGRLVDDHVSGRANEERALWALLGLEVWHRTFFGAQRPATTCR